MKNLKHYSDCCFDFHKEVVESKNTTQNGLNYKDRVRALEERIEKQFDTYEELFEENTLENMVVFPYSQAERIDLLKLYSYKNSVIKRLKWRLTTTDSQRIISTCPNCTISEINSFDHYLPKNEYPGFVVNPKNLFPSCTICNGHKSVVWREYSQRKFLNLYLDHLPSEQYLFVRLSFTDDIVSAEFSLRQPDGIERNLWNVIDSHYTKLHLLSRFSNSINEVITSLENTIITYGNTLTTEQLSSLIVEKGNRDRSALGSNFWKSILEIELANNHDYLNRVLGR